MLFPLVLAALLWLLPQQALAQDIAFVVNRRGDTVAVVDTGTRQILEEIEVGGRPKSLAVTPDGQFVYVTVGQDKVIAVISVADLEVVATIDASGPQGIAITPDGQFAYVSARFAGVEVFRLSDNTLFETITSDFFDTSQELAITPSGSHVYVANIAFTGKPNSAPENVTVIETATNTVVAAVDVSALVNNFGPWGVTALPDGKKVYSNDGDNGEFVYEIDSDPSSATFNQVTDVIQIGTQGNGPRGMDSGQTPSGVRVYAALSESDEVVVIDPTNNQIVARVDTGSEPLRVRLNPAGTELWIALRGSDEVLVLDTQTNTEIATISGFDEPNDIAFLNPTNQPPDCSGAAPSVAEIWPPNHTFVGVNIVGVTDPDGDPVTITVTKITQDEPLNTFGDGNFEPDGGGLGTSTAQVRAERSGSKTVPGNGRVYEISFTADDGQGGTCDASVTVCVPHDQRPGHVCIDDGQDFNSVTGGAAKRTVPADNLVEKATLPDGYELLQNYPNPFNPTTTLRFSVPEASVVKLVVYDVLGREVRVLVDGTRAAGTHEVVFDASTLPSGTYLYRLETPQGSFVQTMQLMK